MVGSTFQPPAWWGFARLSFFLAPLLRRAAAQPQDPFTITLREYITIFSSASEGSGATHQIHVSEYYGRVAVGTPPQEFDVVFDTGSGNVVLPTIKCTDEACRQHRRFAYSNSASAVQVASEDGTPVQDEASERDTTTITYGTGRLTGEYVRDKLCLLGPGGIAAGDAVCTTTEFLGVVQESRFPFIELPFDGIIGLGLDGLSVAPGFNIVRNLQSNPQLREPMFAVFLRKLQTAEESEISLGGYRPERLEDPAALRWMPMLRQEAEAKGYWLVTMKDVYVNGIPMGFCDDFLSSTPRCQVAMDTGSSLMIGPSADIKELLRTIGGCTGSLLPAITFTLDTEGGGTFDVVLDPEDYMEQSSEGGCSSAFQPMNFPPTLGSMWVFGQTALRKYYSVYDASRWRVGLGLARHVAPSSAPKPAQVAPHSSAVREPPAAEACEDNTSSMVHNHLPGCQSFAARGYCRRFGILARNFCPKSCGACRPHTAPLAAASALGSLEAPAAASALAIGGANPAQPAPVRRSGRLTVHKGFSVSEERTDQVDAGASWSSSAFRLPTGAA